MMTRRSVGLVVLADVLPISCRYKPSAPGPGWSALVVALVV